MTTEIPEVAAGIKNLSLRVSNKLRKSGALIMQSMHKRKNKALSLLIFIERNNILNLPSRNQEVFINVNLQGEYGRHSDRKHPWVRSFHTQPNHPSPTLSPRRTQEPFLPAMGTFALKGRHSFAALAVFSSLLGLLFQKSRASFDDSHRTKTM